MALAEDIKSVVAGGRTAENEPMARHASFRTGGPADIFTEPAGAEELAAVLAIVRERGIPYYIMGNGTNLLVSDKGVRGVVIKIGAGFSKAEARGEELFAGAGILLSAAAGAALAAGLGGMEFAAGIPGSLGGAVCMNAGAYGGEMKDILVSAEVLTEDGSILTLSAGELELGYRTSLIQRKGYIVLSARLKLTRSDKDGIREKMADLAARRRDKQPLNFPSAGSTFKRPEGYFAGKLIEDSGLKGYRAGGAEVSLKHAGFVVNTGNAQTKDILAVIEHCRRTVFEKFGVELETEVKFIGER